ncbi:hypothetical protein ILP92_08265 [Maribius pontilimi]|uniref:Avidin family protein n=1 Tax=Palleronia pontilimi TaxID=1964209 RepID=A0A934MDT9_9RHOB|nr:hypothetical protein [Palleronia pontilimi]MBJ3762736.1 hypothetical protein [Palleronia pontilimi]
MTKTIFKGFLAAGLLAAAPLAAMEVTGTGHGTSDNQPMPLTEDIVAVQVASTYERFDSDDPDNPLVGLSGPCWGSMLMNAGAVSGSGLCRYSDEDGGEAVLSWTAEAVENGRTQGSWEVVGGTGSWEGVTGGGSFDAGTDDAGAYTNNVIGELTMP